MKPLLLKRRTVLRGLGAAVALPTLEAMLNSHGTAYAGGAPVPKRFATFFFGNGVILNRWRPSATGADWPLSEELTPLANVKSYVNVVSGYKIKIPNLRGHHTGAAGILSGYPFIPLPPGGAPYNSKFGGPSVDQVAADAIGSTATFPSIQVAVSKRLTRGEGPTLQFISHRGPDAPLPQEFNPAALFNRLFASFSPHDPTDPRDRLRVSVLDAVREDVHKLQVRLGAPDRARLDAHLTGIAEVRSRILALPPQFTTSCVLPDPPTEDNRDINGIEQLESVSVVMSDLLALAFACDLTRVASYQFSGSVGSTVYSAIGQTTGEHTLTHDAQRQNDVHDAVVFVMERFAYLLEKLKASIEGTGNLLDNCCILFSSDVCEGLVHSITDYPILVAGRAGGFLKYPGIHHRSTTQDNSSDVLLTCLRAVGVEAESVGSEGGFSNTPCAGIIA
ncbi:MAG TPA: DUF1552 domain-containing protein [Myxococcaceae bacterium]|nr:DUF1552 domain-containing protein [Myxococcaceae bacterium]